MIAMATGGSVDAGTTFFRLRPSDFTSAWHSQTGQNIATFFKMARQHKPAIIFIDEVDGVCSARGNQDDQTTLEVKSILLQEIGDDKDDANKGLFFMAATNVADMLDPAFLRRYQRAVYIGMPQEEQRKSLLNAHLNKIKNVLTDSQVDELVDEFEGFSAADIIRCLDEATSYPVEKVLQAKSFVQAPNLFQCLEESCENWHPAYKDQAGAVPKDPSMTEVKFCKPPLTVFDVRASLEQTTKTVTPTDLYNFQEFGKLLNMDIKEPGAAPPDPIKCSSCQAQIMYNYN